MKKAITLKGRSFVNRTGEPVILNGINIVCKSPQYGFLFPMHDLDWDRMKRWKIDLVRLGINWSGLEPVAGVIDEHYLDRIEGAVREYEAHGIPVFLDMHQDLYGIKYSNGAPYWACLDGGKPHIRKGEWYNSYHMSEAVQAAEDAFWANTPAYDGVGLIDHFAAVWHRIAERFAEDPNVIGYDIINEPIQGSPCREVGRTLLNALADWQTEVRGRKVTYEEAYELYWNQPEYHACLVDLDPEKCLELENRALPLCRQFDTEILQPFYEKVAARIREADTESIIFLGNSNQTNNGTASSLKPIMVNGKRDPLQVFACHAYDLITDAPNQAAYRQDRINAMLLQHFALADQYDWPVLVGEWGAFPRESYTSLKKYRETRAFLAEHGVSQTYWCYESNSVSPYFLDEYFR